MFLYPLFSIIFNVLLCVPSQLVKETEKKTKTLTNSLAGPALLCFVTHNFPLTYLFELRDRLPSGCRGDHSFVAPRAELQGQRESRNQVHPQLCHAHFIILHPDAPLGQDQ